MTDHSPETMEDWIAWATRNSRKLAYGAGAVIVVAGAAWWYQVSSARKETFAQQSLEQARASAEAGNLPLAASDLTRIIERFGGTRAADEGVIMLAQVRLLQGQTDAAVTGLQNFVSGRHPDYVMASALALLGGGLEDQGKMREAGEVYRRAADAAPLDFLKAQYLLDAGRSLAVAGDTVAARAEYGKVLTEYGELDQSSEARVRMGELGGTVPPSPTGASTN